MQIQGRQDFRRPFAVTVYVDGRKLYPDYSQKVYNHSPSGFQWGYSGSGPAQFALALLLCVTDEGSAVWLHQEFKREFIATLPKDQDFSVDDLDIEAWVTKRGYLLDNENAEKNFIGKEKEQSEGESGECSFPDRCQRANWKECDCICGGANHGIQLKMFAEGR